jgi:hypothetical protein
MAREILDAFLVVTDRRIRVRRKGSSRFPDGRG